MAVQVDQERNRDRAKSVAGVAVFHALLGYALIYGLGIDVVQQATQQLKMFDVKEEPPPPPAEPPIPEQARTEKPKPIDPEGAASAANLKNTPSPIVAPPPEIRLPVPPPVIAAPIAAQGSAPAAGAAPIRGPGTGAGGVGYGTGSGAYGNGTGGGGGGGMTPARWIRGGISESDYPRGAWDAGAGGTVSLRFNVGTDGRVRGCRVTRSSGRSDLDNVTCRLIERRFVYRPATDMRGRPVVSTVIGQHEWVAERRPFEVIEEEEQPYRD